MFVLLSSAQKKELAQFIRDYETGDRRYSDRCPIHIVPSSPIFYPTAGRLVADGNPGRRFVFLLRAVFCYCARLDDFADGQGI